MRFDQELMGSLFYCHLLFFSSWQLMFLLFPFSDHTSLKLGLPLPPWTSSLTGVPHPLPHPSTSPLLRTPPAITLWWWRGRRQFSSPPHPRKTPGSLSWRYIVLVLRLFYSLQKSLTMLESCDENLFKKFAFDQWVCLECLSMR